MRFKRGARHFRRDCGTTPDQSLSVFPGTGAPCVTSGAENAMTDVSIAGTITLVMPVLMWCSTRPNSHVGLLAMITQAPAWLLIALLWSREAANVTCDAPNRSLSPIILLVCSS